MKEIWRDGKGYEGKYQVSNMGRVWSIKGQKYLKGTIAKSGYVYVHLTAKNGKAVKERLHRLVAIAFLENPNNLPAVNHKDENKLNNSLDNLEWCSHQYNCNYGTRNQRITESRRATNAANKLKSKKEPI